MKTARAIVLAICATLLFGAFAAAQYGRPFRGGSVAPRVLSNLIEARDLMGSVSREASINSDMLDTREELEAAIRTLQGAMQDAGMDPNRLPPPLRTDQREPSLVRIKALVDDSRRLIASGRELNGDMRARLQSDVDTEVAQAQQHIDHAVSTKAGQYEQQHGRGPSGY